MSSKRLGKRERAAKKRRISIRRTKSTTHGSCERCSTPVTCKLGPGKEKSLFFKLVCGQCRKSATRALEYRE